MLRFSFLRSAWWWWLWWWWWWWCTSARIDDAQKWKKKWEKKRGHKTKMIIMIISLSRTLSFFFSLFSLFQCINMNVMVECVVSFRSSVYTLKKRRYEYANMMQFNDHEHHWSVLIYKRREYQLTHRFYSSDFIRFNTPDTISFK